MSENRTNCGDCALYANGLCRMTGLTVNAETDYCSKCAFSTYKCDICGRETIEVIYDVTNPDKILKICQTCSEASGTCATCKYSNRCDFNENPSPTPKMVQKQIRQGNTTMITQIPNPDRIRETCQNGCKCYIEDFGCCRQFNTCENYEWGL